MLCSKVKEKICINNPYALKGQQKFLGFNIPVIEGGFGENQKVMLAKTIAEIHDIELKTINQLINNNIDEFEVGIDILDLKGNENFKVISNDLKLSSKFVSNSKNIYLLSEQGYFALVMLMRSEKAKEIRKMLRREYFAMREEIKTIRRSREEDLDVKERSE